MEAACPSGGSPPIKSQSTNGATRKAASVRFSLLHLGQSIKLLLRQFLEQRLGVLQVGGVEALGEPVVDFGEHRASFLVSRIRRIQRLTSLICDSWPLRSAIIVQDLNSFRFGSASYLKLGS